MPGISIPPSMELASLPSTAAVLAIFLVALLLLTFRLNRKLSARNFFPPGPRKFPFVGNLFQVDALRPYPQFRVWAKEYGPIFHLQLGPQHVIVLNTAEAADELFVNRSKLYSSRPPVHVAQDIMSVGQRMAFLPYGKEWKAARRSLQSSIGPGVSRKIRPAQEIESRVLLHDILAHGNQSLEEVHASGPDDKVPEGHWFSLMRRYTTSIVMILTYGKRVNKIFDNHNLHKIYEVVDNFTRISQPGNYLADVFPILRKLPDCLSPWRVRAQRMHEWEMELWGGLLEDLKKEIKNGTDNDSYVGSYLRQREKSGQLNASGCGLTADGWLKDTFLAYTAGTVLEAGSDTTASTMTSFILLMLSHPHVFRTAREEIDRVIGPDRMPTFEDEKNLPYLVACIKETLRRRPPAIMGIPHSADEDDSFLGYHIPKGSTVIGNVWAIHMDSNRYPNPTAFDPERYLINDKPVRWGGGPDIHDRDHYVFGWGRRFCQGSSIAEASLFITLSRIVWGIDFAAPVNPNTGVHIIPDIADEERTFSDGFVSNPKCFPVGFKARSEKHAEIINRAFEEAQAEWQAMGLAVDER